MHVGIANDPAASDAALVIGPNGMVDGDDRAEVASLLSIAFFDGCAASPVRKSTNSAVPQMFAWPEYVVISHPGINSSLSK
jgi:hypothetical protein